MSDCFRKVTHGTKKTSTRVSNILNQLILKRVHKNHCPSGIYLSLVKLLNVNIKAILHEYQHTQSSQITNKDQISLQAHVDLSSYTILHNQNIKYLKF